MIYRLKKKCLVGLSAGIVCLLLASCDNSDSTDHSKKTSSQTRPVRDADTSAASAGTKLNYYVKCFNTADGAVRSSAQRYVSWFSDAGIGPTGKEKNINTLGDFTPAELTTCSEAITAAGNVSPSMPELENAAGRYLSALKELQPLMSEAYSYYSQEDYKDDGFEKGKKLHQPLMQSFDNFINVSDEYGKKIDKETSVLYAKQLSEIEKKEGKHVSYYRLALVTQGKALTTILAHESVDIQRVNKAIENYSALLSASRKATDNESGKPISWSVFLTNADNFLRDCKDRMRRLRDNTPYSRSEKDLMESSDDIGWTVEGSPMKVIRSYNELVKAGNRL
ncbi:YiiG family protein [Enterobacter cancerogenus]|uniref:YiiG family protein n=1 Tax=Enterobacter cancerogenus TaxID=69218 RepID=UPI000692522A|nr:YiiG family protein [Enterobacter cancerogenus]